MRKGIRLCLGFLALFALPALCLSISSDVSALRHNYTGVPIMNVNFPALTSDGGNAWRYDWDTSDMSAYQSNISWFYVGFEGDSYDSDFLNSVSARFSSSFLSSSYDSSFNRCTFGENANVRPIISFGENSIYFHVTDGHGYYPSDWTNISGNALCRRRSSFGSSDISPSVPPFDTDSLPSGILSCNKQNGAVCGGLWNASEYVSDRVLPYWYSSDSVMLQSHYIDSDTGYSYSNTFDFNDVLTATPRKFSTLHVPLWDYDGYFWDSSNLYSGRDIEFAGAFEFDGTFAWHDNINNNGSHFQIQIEAMPKNGSNNNSPEGEFFNIDCTTNLVTIGDLTRLEYTCPYTLTKDYISFIPSLDIDGNGNYVWITNDNWYFAMTYLVTDNDDSPGYSFNSYPTGGGDILGSAESLASIGSSDVIIDASNLGDLFDRFFPNLIGMFSFNLFNPFSSLFAMFTSGDSCVNIPIIGSMLHVENSQVCPYFPATVRNILTPVMSIIATMLLFGFLVRWIRSSSSDFSPGSSGGKL